MEELWVDIPNFRRYQVSNLGHIWNVVFKRPMKPSRTQAGHLKISLIDDDGVRRHVGVARLVAQAFVEPPNYLCTEVILLDGDLFNVAAYNLAWRGPRTAYLYARQMHNEQPDAMYVLGVRNLTTGATYKNIIEAGTTEGLLFWEILLSCHDQRKVPPFGYTYGFL